LLAVEAVGAAVELLGEFASVPVAARVLGVEVRAGLVEAAAANTTIVPCMNGWILQ
jgi:hypothetical protein